MKGAAGLLARYAEDRVAAAALALFALLALAALAAPWLAPQNPYDLAQLDILDARLPPGSAAGATELVYRLGTDAQGRDMLSAMLYGLRISLAVGFAATAGGLALGLLVGLSSALAGGRVDALIMRAADLQLAFPAILLALILLAALGPGPGKIVAALVAAQWAYYARAVRGVALVEREKDYIAAVRLLGLSGPRILFRHLLPNCLPALIVVATLQVGAAIALEATLSFLGVGLPVTEPSLGLLIANGFQYLLSGKYWISVFPGLLLLGLILAINLVAERLRVLLNPRLQGV
ncbi:MAG: ABC transporter permease [Rhodocyclaceae bacterium]|nr:ABC transporter permease [Rhodocyclaceae bacterium]